MQKLTLNTHDYDGHLPYQSILGKILLINRTKPITNPNLLVGKFILDLLKTPSCPPENSVTSNCLTQVLNSWGAQPNYDNANKMSADELLVLCAESWNNLKIVSDELLIDFSNEFFLAFEDMARGMCAQGRTTRLWQFLNAYILYHPLYNKF